MALLVALWDEGWADLQVSWLSVNEVGAKLDLVYIDRRYQELPDMGPSPGGAFVPPDCRVHHVPLAGPAPLCPTPATRGLELYANTPMTQSPDALADGDHHDRGGDGLWVGGQSRARG
jgi:hypothetical protein